MQTENDKLPPDSDPSDAQLLEELSHPPVEPPALQIDKGKIRKEATQRAAKTRPLLQRIVQAVTREKKPFREIILNSEPLEKRAALLVDGVLEKFEVERTGEDRMVGAIFKGKIQNLEPGLKAAFVDIGQPKNAFLHYWDILPTAGDDKAVEFVRENKTAAQIENTKISLKDIPRLYPIGTEIVVQITKTQIGTKGPRTTTNIALPGRYIVLMPYAGQCGISRKIEDPEERRRLKEIIRELTIPPGMGIIIRTAGEGQKVRWFVRDLHLLLAKWEVIRKRIEDARQPTIVYQEPDLLERCVRDFLTEDIDRVMIDNAADFARMQEVIQTISPRSKSKVFHFKDDIPIFERYNIERQIEQTFMTRVSLPSGGEIVIEETEAMITCDVNTGSHKGTTRDGKDFILQANLEAATEVARQCRLRNMGGLVIIDFIDMKNKRDRQLVYNRMRDEMAKDRAKSHILPISQLGIMQMTRQRHSESTTSSLYQPCPYCRGRGIVKSARTMSVEIQRRVVSVIRHEQNRVGREAVKGMQLRVLLHPANLERLRHEDEHILLEIEESFGVHLSFRADLTIHVENFKIFDAKTNRELR